MCSLAAIGLSGTVSAALDIQAKAVKTASNQEEEIWVIRLDLKNTGSTPLGPLVIQYRYSGYSEFDSDGKPEGPFEHTEGRIKEDLAVIAPGQQASVDSGGMTFAGEADMRKLAKGMISRRLLPATFKFNSPSTVGRHTAPASPMLSFQRPCARM